MNVLNRDLFRRPIVLGAIVAIVALVLAWWFAWMSPQSAKLTSLAAQKVQEQQTYASLEVQLASLKAEEKSVKAASPFLKRFESAIPSAVDAPSLVVELYNLSEQDDVALDSVTDNSVSPTALGFSTIPVAISIQGGHDNVLRFIKGIYDLPRLLTIQSVNVSGSGDINTSGNGTYTASINATAYTTSVSGSSTTTSATVGG